MTKTPFVPRSGIERHFAMLSAIPHGSKNERALSDAIRTLAEDAGLAAEQDALGNLLVRKPAGAGSLSREPVLLQAHLDMVCTRTPGCKHDFSRDPLSLYVDERGWLRADGVSLGADDGYGVAYMLDVLLRNDLKHPPLECLFTVQEEIGLVGMNAFDCSRIAARRIVSMDCFGETGTTAVTCGGRRMTFALPLTPVPAQGRRFRLTVCGLTGGHSAENIRDSRANAVKLLAHAAMAMEESGAVLVCCSGGEAANAIPRDASADLLIPPEGIATARRAAAALDARFRKIHAATDPELRLSLEEADFSAETAYSLRALRLIAALPDGIRAMDAVHPGEVALSDNLGALWIRDGVAFIQSMIRSTCDEWKELLAEQMRAAAEAFGATIEVDSDYPGMEYRPRSTMRDVLSRIVGRVHGRALQEVFVHGGMEIGILSRRIPDADIVTLGVDGEGAHSPGEGISLESFNRAYGMLVELLEQLA